MLLHEDGWQLVRLKVGHQGNFAIKKLATNSVNLPPISIKHFNHTKSVQTSPAAAQSR